MKKILILSLLISSSIFAFAQVPASPPVKKKIPKRDGYAIKQESVADTVVPYAEVKDEDIVYRKRIWRDIDLRDQGNEILASPKVNFVNIIYQAIKNGELDLYGETDESFDNDPISSKSTAAGANTSYSAADTAFLGVNAATNELNTAGPEFFKDRFIAIRLKEDWILDIKRGIFEPRIVGLALVRLQTSHRLDQNGNALMDSITNKVKVDTLGTPTVGWLYFDDLRHILVKAKIANNQNDNSGINFDDVFVRRLFFSNIVKVSSSGDERLKDIFANSTKDQLLESERIKKAMADFEQGLWEY